MNRDLLMGYISRPLELPAGAVNDLYEIVKRYPYFQGGYLMLTRSLKNANDLRFEEVLKDAAVHSPDRSRLYDFVNHVNAPVVSVNPTLVTNADAAEKQQEEIPQPEIMDAPAEVVTLASVTEEVVNLPTEQDIITEILNYPEIEAPREQKEVEEQPEAHDNKAHTFFEWLEILSGVGQPEANTEKGISKPDKVAKTRAELIEQFILAEPKISRPVKAEFYSPVSMAKRSTEDRHEIVSETLANVYIEQGNAEKAIQILQKLFLQNPAKSSYFAALIEKLENQS